MNATEALARLRRLHVPVATTSDAAAVLGIRGTAATQTLRRLASSGLVTPLRRGFWILADRPDPPALPPTTRRCSVMSRSSCSRRTTPRVITSRGPRRSGRASKSISSSWNRVRYRNDASSTNARISRVPVVFPARYAKGESPDKEDAAPTACIASIGSSMRTACSFGSEPSVRERLIVKAAVAGSR